MRERAPELIPRLDGLSRFDAQVTALVVSALPAFVLLILAFGQENLLRPISFLIAGALITTGSVVAEWRLRRSMLQSSKRDYEEAQKLGALSERAEDIVADARSTLVSIGNTFLSEAVRVGNALGGLERIGILNLAAAVPVEQVETLADRILESSQHEMTELVRLAQEVS